MLKFSKIIKKDLLEIGQIYIKAFNQMWENRDEISVSKIMNYRFSKKVKIKMAYGWKVIWACFSDVKPLYFGNILFDWDLFVDPEYQNKWFGRNLFLYIIKYTKEKFDVKFRDFFTFKWEFQEKRYEKIWFYSNDKRIMMSWKLDEIEKNLIL
jgi:GNAT superfamily N-acetyltransferase